MLYVTFVRMIEHEVCVIGTVQVRMCKRSVIVIYMQGSEGSNMCTQQLDRLFLFMLELFMKYHTFVSF